MKILIFSDVHGNRLALERMLYDTRSEGIVASIFCGDILGYFDEQKDVIDLLLSIKKLYIVKGNHDNNYLQGLNNYELQLSFAQSYGISYLNILSKEYLEFLSKLNSKEEFSMHGYKINVFHGSNKDNLNGRIYPDTKQSDIEWIRDISIMGHTHYKMYRSYEDFIMINPGSLGQPRDGQGYSYCIYDLETKTVDFRTVKIDNQYLAKRLKENEISNVVVNYLLDKLK